MKINFLPALLLALFTGQANLAQAQVKQEASLVSISTHDSFFNQLRQLCGKAFEGKVAVDNPKSDKLFMHRRALDFGVASLIPVPVCYYFWILFGIFLPWRNGDCVEYDCFHFTFTTKRISTEILSNIEYD